LWVRNIPVEVEECKWIYERSYIWIAEKAINFMIDHRSYTHNLSSSNIWWSFIYSFTSFTIYGYITNSQSDLLSKAW